MKFQVYEIKIKRSWKKVRATSMKALSDYTKQNTEIKDWRMVGMMSRVEIAESQGLEVVA